MSDQALSPINRADALAQARQLYQAFCAYAATRMAVWEANERDAEQAARLARFDARQLERGAATMAALMADDELLDPISTEALSAYSESLSAGPAHDWDDDEAIRFWVGEFPRVVQECLAWQDQAHVRATMETDDASAG